MSLLLHNAESGRAQSLSKEEAAAASIECGLTDLCALTAKICGTQTAFVVITENDYLSVRSHSGFEHNRPQGEIPATLLVRAEDGPFVVEDTQQHTGFVASTLGRVFPEGRFFACSYFPVENFASGALCVLDRSPRVFHAELRSSLDLLAQQVKNALEIQVRLRSAERSARAKTRIEQALTVERNFVSAVLDTVGSMVLVLDTTGRIVRFNRSCELISGYTFAEVVGRPFWEMLLPSEEVDEAFERFDEIRSGRPARRYELHWLTKDGQVKTVSWANTCLLDTRGEVNFVIATGTDVTEQRRAEMVLKESEARYRELIENGLGIVATHDLNGVLLSINRYAVASSGYSEQDLLGQPVSRLMPEPDNGNYKQYLEKLTREGEDQGLWHVRDGFGKRRVIAYRNRLLRVSGKEPIVLVHGLDVTEETDTAQAFRALSRQSESILNSVADGIWSMDRDGLCTIVNPAAAQMFGFEPDDLLGKNMHALTHHTRADGTPYPEAECRALTSLESTEAVHVMNEVFWRKDGTSFPVDYVACPLIDDGRPVGVVVAFQDVTERRGLEKMKDEFISTVSHELRTPLTSLRAALGLIVGGALQSRPEKLSQMLSIAIGNCDRLVQLVNDILDLERLQSGKLQLHPQLCDVEELLQRSQSLTEAAASKAGVDIQIVNTANSVWGDPERVLQILTNLLGNAIKFSHASGVVWLEAKVGNEKEVVFSVCDRGRGVPPEKLDAIFERFQQADASDSRSMGGPGLGLSICRSLVAQQGGRIWAESKLGEGSCFYFTLPRRAP